MRKMFLLAGAAAALLSAPSVAQPNFSRNPSFGTLNLTAGFANDPRIVNVTAGGTLSASTLAGRGQGCEGTVLNSTVANAPDVRVNYQAGSFPLTFWVSSDADTTLIINGPDGTWYCNDDGSGLNPVINFANPGSGQYDIYIGVYGGGRRIPAQLRVTELGPPR